MNEIYNLSRLSEDQVEVACEMVIRAFHEEPLLIYISPDPIYRKKRGSIMFKNLIISGMLSGEVYTTSRNIESIAVWHPFGKFEKKSTIQSKELIKKLRKIRREMYSDHDLIERNSNVSEVTTAFHYKHANFPHWFLSLIAVDPVHQGKGFASKLIRMKLAQADKTDLPCYLNTENKEKVPLYEHLGFKLVETGQVPHSELYVYGMLRKKNCK